MSDKHEGALKMGAPVFVINLDRSTGRLAQISADIAEAGRDFIRIPATNGHALDIHNLTIYDKTATRRFMGREITAGEVGCFLSHVDAAKAVVASGAPYGFVLEDDAMITPQLFSVTEQAVDWLDTQGITDWRLLNLGNPPTFRSKELTRFAQGHQSFSFLRAHYFPMGAFSLCWSQKGAQDFLNVSKTIYAPLDNLLRHWLSAAGGGYAFSPRLGWVRTDDTDIGEIDERRFHGRTWDYGFRRQKRMLTGKFAAWRRFRKDSS